MPTQSPVSIAFLRDDALTGIDGKIVRYRRKGVFKTTEAGAPTKSIAATVLMPGMDRILENGITPCGG